MKTSIALFTLCACASAALAHDGPRLKIEIHNGQLVARGYLSTGVDDGGGVIRPYYNAIHSHWLNNADPNFPQATATLPGYDLFTAGPLTGFDLTLTLTGASKWVNPPIMPTPDVVPNLEPLSQAEEIFVTRGANFVTTNAPGPLPLLTNIPPSGVLDIDLAYDIAAHPANVIYVLEFQLSTNAPGVLASDSIHILLAPDGSNPIEHLHQASLFLEHNLGQPLCAPDFNKDGMVDGSDLASLLVNWGTDGADDLNSDGVIDGADLARLLVNWGSCL